MRPTSSSAARATRASAWTRSQRQQESQSARCTIISGARIRCWRRCWKRSITWRLAAFKTFGDNLSGSPAAIIDALFKDLAAWSDTPRWAGSGFTRLVIELADLRGHPARLIARRHKALLEGHLGDLLAKHKVPSPRQRAREVWLLSEGAISLILIHGDRNYAAAAAEAAKRLIQAGAYQRAGRRRKSDR